MRKRPVECYYWALGIFYEPQYAKARIVLTKMLTLLTMFDDIFDSYGTMEEVHLFNQAVQRCVLGTSSPYVMTTQIVYAS